jgi:carbonic anhydrase
MIEFTYRVGRNGRKKTREQLSPADVQRQLERGNGGFSRLIDGVRRGKTLRHVTPIAPEDLGIGGAECAVQAPHAAVLACSDARVPTEMVFQQGFNDLFVVRVAGNVLGSECLGSLRYAVDHFPDTLRLLAVLGHANCGAVTAAVDAFLEPKKYLDAAGNYPLRTIIDQIIVSARAADLGLHEAHGARVAGDPGYRAALIRVTVALNAAWNAFNLRQELTTHAPHAKVVFGVYDLGSHNLALSPPLGDRRAKRGFFDPPADAGEFRELIQELCAAALTRR